MISIKVHKVLVLYIKKIAKNILEPAEHAEIKDTA